MPEVSLLEVLLHGNPVGTLTLLPGERTPGGWRGLAP